MLLYPTFDKAVAGLQCQLKCLSHPREIVWFFSEDVIAQAGHAFFPWPPEDNNRQIRERYERLKAADKPIKIGYYCTVGDRSACYITSPTGSDVIVAHNKDGSISAVQPGLFGSYQMHPATGHKVPRLLWPLLVRVMRLAQPDPSLHDLKLMRKEAFPGAEAPG